MGFSLMSLFKVGLMLVNSVLILNRKRFLAKHGLDDMTNMGHAAPNAVKTQIAGLLHAVQYLRLPVIGANALIIFLEIILGG